MHSHQLIVMFVDTEQDKQKDILVWCLFGKLLRFSLNSAGLYIEQYKILKDWRLVC